MLALCREVRMSRQNYYRKRRQRQRQQIDEELVVELVQKERRQHPRMGARKLLKNIGPELGKAGIQVGRDRFLAILRRHDLLVEKRPRKSWTTQSLHHFYKYPNELKKCSITAAHEAWVSDLTYIRSEEGFLYLSLITDDFSRKIVGWEAADGLEAEGCLRALRKALGQLPEGREPIHHSDRGIQYCCQDYTELLQSHALTISMTEDNHCYEKDQSAYYMPSFLFDEHFGKCCRSL